MALTKAAMAEQLFEVLGLNKREAKELVEQFFEEIRASLEHGGQVKLSGFGNFDLREKRERPARNPTTGEEIPIQCITASNRASLPPDVDHDGMVATALRDLGGEIVDIQ